MANKLIVPLNLDALRVSNIVVTEEDKRKAKQRKYNREYWRKNRDKLAQRRSSQYKIWLASGDNVQKRKAYHKEWYQKRKKGNGLTTESFIERLKKLNAARIAERIIKANILAEKLRALG